MVSNVFVSQLYDNYTYLFLCCVLIPFVLVSWWYLTYIALELCVMERFSGRLLVFVFDDGRIGTPFLGERSR